MKKKILLILLTFVVCITALTVAVCATEEESTGTESTEESVTYVTDANGGYQSTDTNAGCTSEFTWTLENGTLTIKPIGNETTLSTQKASSKNGAFQAWREAYPDSVKAVTTIIIDSQFKTITYQHGTCALANWVNVTTIDIGGLKTVTNENAQGGVFQGNTNLTTVYGDGQDMVIGTVNLSNLKFASSEVYANNWKDDYNMRKLFYGCSKITNVIFPTSASTNISREMFRGCSSLESVEIPSWVTYVNVNAFYGCTALKSITFHSNISSIEASALTNCTALTSITIENASATVPTIPTNANGDTITVTCASAAQYETLVALGRNDIEIVYEVPENNLLSTYNGYQYGFDLETGVMTIKKVDETTTTVLSTDLDLDFKSLVKTIIISEDTGVTEIGANMFDGFAAETVVIPSTVKTVSSKAFANMPNLKTVVDHTAYTADATVGAGVINIMTATSVASDAFSGSCAALTPTVYMGKTVAISGETLDWFAEDAAETICVYPSTDATTFFRNNAIAFEYLTVEQTGDALLAREYSSTNETWTFDTESGKLTITSKSNGNFSIGKNVTAWPNWKEVWKDAIEYFFLDGFKNGGSIYYQWQDSPFYGLVNLKHVHMGTITVIRRSTYGTTGLFSGCPSLTTVSYGDDSTYDGVVDLSWWKKNDYMMKHMFYNCSSVTKVILPSNLTKYDAESSSDIGIFSSMFSGCSALEEVDVGTCFTTIYDNAFKNCTSLKTVKLAALPYYYDLTAFPDQEGLTIEVANSFVASLFDDYNFTLTKVTYPEGEANSYFVEVAQPVTNVIGDLSAIRPLDSADELSEIIASETPPAAVLVDIDSSLNVIGLDMTVSELLSALEYRIFAAFRVSDSETVTALHEYLDSIGFTDAYIIGSPELIQKSYALNYKLHHIVDYSDVYTTALSEADCVAIRRDIYTNGAKMAILPYSACSREIINDLYDLSVIVWVEMPETSTVLQQYSAVLSGAVGIITEETDKILDIACNSLAENTMTRYPKTSGHRGNETVTPENTLEGCLYAVNHGAKSVEIDIYITTDGEVVLMHDSTTKRTCNANLTVEDSTLAELKELYVNKGFEDHDLYSQCRIPTLGEIFEALKDYDVLINIEFKTTKDEAVDAVIALIEEYDVYDKCCFSSFKFNQFKRMHDSYPELPGIMLFRPILMQDYSADLNALYVINTTGNYNANASLTNTDNVGGAASMSALIRRGVPVQSWNGTGLANRVLSGMHEIGDGYARYAHTLYVSGASSSVQPGTSETLSASYMNYFNNMMDVTDVTYTIIEGADLAAIDADTGVITYGDTEGTVSFIATYKYPFTSSVGDVVGEYYVSSDVYTVNIEAEETVEFSGVVTMNGFSVRVASYNGLRGLFSADISGLDALKSEGYELLEFGSLVSSAANRENCVLTVNNSGDYVVTADKVIKTEIWNSIEGQMGKYLSTTTDSRIDFAITVIEFAEANYTSDIYFCAYEIWKNPEGETVVYYKNCKDDNYDEVSLYQICNKMWTEGTITESIDAERIVRDIIDAVNGSTAVAMANASVYSGSVSLSLNDKTKNAKAAYTSTL